MKSSIVLSTLSPFSVFAHSGHPGPATHGDFTHLIVGSLIALPIAGLLISFACRSRKKAAVKVTRRDQV